jgi:hypothetical protein
LRAAIAAAVIELQNRQARSSRLLVRSIELGKQTLEFMQRLMMPQTAYDARGNAARRRTLLLDGHA